MSLGSDDIVDHEVMKDATCCQDNVGNIDCMLIVDEEVWSEFAP
jgi:hypothetical protein